MNKKMQLFLLFICCIALPAMAGSGGVITRLSDKQSVSFAQMVAGAQGADVIFVAETHDDKRHHAIQLEIVTALQAKKVPLAIGLEMFQADNQSLLDDWIAGKIPEQNFMDIYRKNWSYDWAFYRDVFIYARDNHIPLIALNIPKAIVFKVAKQGYASLTPAERENIPSGVSCRLNNPQTEFLKKTFQEVFKHDANGKVFSYFCEAQAVRNSGMAMNIANSLKKNPGRKIVVLAGTWHAVKHGIPEGLENIGSRGYTVILPEIPELGRENVTPALADYLIEM